MLQDPSDPNCGLDIQTAFFALSGQLASITAQIEQHVDELLALSYQVPEDHRRRLADEILVRLNIDQKRQHVVRIAREVYGEEHVTPKFLEQRWHNVNTVRNRLAHGYLTTAYSETWRVELSTGITKSGTRAYPVDVQDLGRTVADAKDVLVHVVCVFSMLPGSKVSPMDFNDLDD